MSTHVPTVSRAPKGPTTTRVAAAFAVLAVCLTALAWFANTHWSRGEYSPNHGFGMPPFWRPWYQFDAGWYELIATKGYVYVPNSQTTVAFFPGYPTAMRLLAPLVGGDAATAGVVITLCCGLGGVLLFARWCRDRLDPLAATLAVGLLLVYPYSWFLVGALYADALFLFATIAAFALLERGHPVLAGIVGAVATATRPVAPAVVLALIIRVIEQRHALIQLAPLDPCAAASVGRFRRVLHAMGAPVGVRLSRLERADAGVLLSAAGFAAYVGYLTVRFGDPLIWASVQKYWNQPSGPVTLFKIHLAGLIVLKFAERWRYILGCVMQGVLTCGALALVPRVVARFGWSYGVLVAVSMGMPFIGSKDFQGTGRYLIAAFPVFALGGEWLAEQSATRRRVVLAASAALLLVWSSSYARGYYVA